MIEFRAGETIHTENSYKYSLELLFRAGARVGMASARGVDRRRGEFFDPRAGFRGRVRPLAATRSKASQLALFVGACPMSSAA